ncbi:calphotin-like [Macrosteles quadrilineatus]|uniref:calphotin-like n=1 Tax=Macrosteles quadrilineatus TaxID=74068 RepID=UPI0023E19A30|nr:calphotin-like [Macrosteles quadrilineatus]
MMIRLCDCCINSLHTIPVHDSLHRPTMSPALIVLLAAIGCAVAAPAPQFIAPVVSAPVVAAPAVVTATSSQYIARNYNGVVAPPAVAVAELPYTYPAEVAPAVEPVYFI